MIRHRLILPPLALLATTFIPSIALADASAELYSTQPYLYGRFEARIRYAPGDGVVSSFFLWKEGSEIEGTFWNELDFEKIGPNCEVQTNALYGNPAAVHKGMYSGSDLCSTYHDYLFEWTPTYIAWGIDGQEIRRDTGATADAFAQNASGGMTIHFNVWPGDQSFGGNYDPAILPVHQYISWVQYSSYNNGAFNLEWREEFDGGSLPSGWAVGDWGSPKNRSTHNPDNVGFVDGIGVLSLTTDSAIGTPSTVPADGTGSGGANTGGSGTGGGDTGGPSSGGADTGGSSSGGVDTGGSSSGGANTGGDVPADTGGSAPGGTSSGDTGGGTNTGGITITSGGGTNVGGDTTGGANTGGLTGSGGTNVGGVATGETSSGGFFTGGRDTGASGGTTSTGSVNGSGGAATGGGVAISGGSGSTISSVATGGSTVSGVGGGNAIGGGVSSSGGTTVGIGGDDPGASDAADGNGSEDSGCACRVRTGEERTGSRNVLGLAALLLLWRRSRSRRPGRERATSATR